jgi:tRNA nucleotidyltransferase (CCA-adding enzyme)
MLDRVAALPDARPLLERLRGVRDVYLVGGAVRDLLLGKRPRELDLVVEGDAAALARRLGNARVHDRFGTSTVTFDGFTYDIAGARTESYSRPGALPDVTPAGIDEDLLRRDFTVNALALALGGDDAGSIRAAPRALEDLEAGRLRVLHERSFIDDPTRLLRLARYAARLRFAIEPETLEFATAAVRTGALRTVSGYRIGTELRLLAHEDDAVAGYEQLAKLDLDAAIHPGFGINDPPLVKRALGLLPADGRGDLVVIGLAARRVIETELRPLLDRLSFPAGDRDVIESIALHAPAVAEELERAQVPSEIAAAAAAAGSEVVAVAGALGPAEQAAAWLERMRGIRLEITGDDLTAAGVAEGPAIGTGLRAALAAKLDGRAPTRAAELERALQAARGTG